MLPECDVCGVQYVEGYEGPCQEYGSGLTDAQFARAAAEGRKPRRCPGNVSLTGTLQRRVEVAERHAEVLAKALDRFIKYPSNSDRYDLTVAVEPTLQALEYGKGETS